MYPLNEPQPWPKNEWYVAALTSELQEAIRDGNGLLARTLLGERVIIFRDEQGVVHALAGVCPHRMMPLELGTLTKSSVVCPYHGLEFAHSGQCIAAPGAHSVPNCSLRRFPVREVGSVIWIWMGAESLANSTPLPDQSSAGVDKEGWRLVPVHRYHLKARYALLIDNLFDLTHVAFIHSSTITNGQMSLAEPIVEDRNGVLSVYRESTDLGVDRTRAFLFPTLQGPFAQRLFTDFLGVSLINSGFITYQGNDSSKPPAGQVNFIHLITPETLHTTHYWILVTRNFRLDDANVDEMLAQHNRRIVDQDDAALVAVESNLRSGLSMPREISTTSDAGAWQVRRRLMQKIRAEAVAN